MRKNKTKLIATTISFILCYSFANPMEDPREGISLPESRIQRGSKHPRDLEVSSISTSITETEFPPNKKVCAEPGTEKGKEPYSAIEFQQYTHSHHNSYCSDPLRALYIDKEARLKYEDQEAGFNWEIPLWRDDDDKYSEITFAHLGVQGNNPLMVKFEIGVEQDEEQEIQWFFRDNLDDNKIPKLYNNSPEQTPIRYPSDNPKIVVVEGKKLETQNTPKIRNPLYPNLSIKPVKQIKPNSAINKKNYPVIDIIGEQSIDCRENEYPHSEIAFLNDLEAHDLLSPLLSRVCPSKIRGIIIKLYSYNDNCSKCQEALCKFRSHLEKKFNEQLGTRFPIFFVSINNKPWNCNPYHLSRDSECEDKTVGVSFQFREIDLRLKSATEKEPKDGGEDHPMSKYARWDNSRCPEESEDEWKEHPISKYVKRDNFMCLSSQQYKPYTHCIEKHPEDSLPNLFLGIQVQRWAK